MKRYLLILLCLATALAAEPADSSEVQTSSDSPASNVATIREDRDYLDFSNMLIPITHEASMLSKYGVRNHRLHRGVDVRITMGEPIVAAFPGVVIVSKFNPGGYGHYVLVQHDNDIQTLYGHLSKREVKVGDKLLPGDIVGLGGNSGRTTGPHLHFEIRYGKYNIDPETVVDFPHWELTEGASRISKSDVITAHRKMQAKLKNEDYIVKEGDTLESIAAWFNISVMSLCRTNNISPENPLKVGQRLRGSSP
jgi:murein DD-endopeptidase MepM/ murein hydrolase activator NlpD